MAHPWSQYSIIDDDGTAEWVSEGIQIGQVKSAMGILGMWTGADHDRTDPIGMWFSLFCLALTDLAQMLRSFLDVESWLGPVYLYPTTSFSEKCKPMRTHQPMSSFILNSCYPFGFRFETL